MKDGDFYTIEEYEQMANEFKKNWSEKHHGSSECSYAELEADYWKLIRDYSSHSPVEVEYANDMSTLEYPSGFMKRMVRHIIIIRLQTVYSSFVVCCSLCQ